ncbi:pyridoxamine 5'-phosphate oxidase family protein [Streptomyces flavalbus]|uniref:Pyridoxamine 5'-phosphate oxidase family protein n=1 Tax=Streptomyces flavalbus TaxID=2665155 RepID=A0ABW2WC89_9ACTN
MALTREEREEFLAQPHIAALSVYAGPDRAPLTVPIWYKYTPGGDVWFMTGRKSRKNQLISKSGRITLMVDRLQPSVRYVSVEGPIVDSYTGYSEHVREMASRYMAAEKVEAYVEYTSNAKEHADTIIHHMRPERWVGSDLGTF